MTDFLLEAAKRIPKKIRKAILQHGLIESAKTNAEVFEYIFDVYEHFLDKNGEHDDFNCSKCRDYVLNQWQLLNPYLQKLENEND